MDKITEIFEAHSLSVHNACFACDWVDDGEHDEHLEPFLRSLLAEVWDEGATAGWNDNGEPNPYEKEAN